jgi:large subunit ribosomal protein L22
MRLVRDIEMEFRAEAKYIRVSPQKVRLVLDLIKGLRVEEALNTLAFTKKGIAPTVHKLLRSAIENANYAGQEKGIDVDVDGLFVKNAISNEGPRMKRIRPAPMGRAFRYQRRMTHISIVLSERNKNGASADLATTVEAAPAKATKGKTAGKAGAKKKAVAKKK